MLLLREQFSFFPAFANLFGNPQERHETLVEVRLLFPSFDSRGFEQLSEAAYREAVSGCREHLANCFDISLSASNEPLPFDWRGDANISWNCLKRYVEDIGSVQVVIILNKPKLIADHFPDRPDRRVILFANSHSMEDNLRSLLTKPAELENVLCTTRVVALDANEALPTVKLIALDLFGCSEGLYCSVVGQDAKEGEPGPEMIVEQLPDLFAYGKARERLYWESPWFRSIAPRHMRIATAHRNDQHASVLKVLDAHAVNICLLYLGTRSWQAGDKLIARFATDRHRLEVELYDRTSDLSAIHAGKVNKLLDLLDFAYQTDRFEDRLSFAQAAVGLVASSGDERRITANELLDRIGQIKEAAEWSWRSFCEERISKYYNDAEAVEDDVSATVEKFDSNTMKLVEDMSKTFLSSIGAFVTAYIAAGLKKEASAAAFQIVLAVYFVYLVFVAGWMNLRFLYDRFRAVQSTIKASLDRHVQVLGTGRVQKLSGNTVANAEKRFMKWFYVTSGLYVLFSIAILLLIAFAPHLLF